MLQCSHRVGHISTLSDISSFSPSELFSPPDIMLIKVFFAWPTTWEVFFAAPATMGFKEMSGKFALSCIKAVSKHEWKSNCQQWQDKLKQVYETAIWKKLTNCLLLSYRTNLSDSSFCSLDSLCRFVDAICYILASQLETGKVVNGCESTNFNLCQEKSQQSSSTWRSHNSYSILNCIMKDSIRIFLHHCPTPVII